MNFDVRPLSFQAGPGTPTVALGQEAIRLAVPELRYEDGVVELVFRSRIMLPDAAAARFHDLSTALCLVVTDVDQRDGFAIKTIDDGVRYPPGEGPPEANLKTLPPLPLPPRGDVAGTSFTGAVVGGSVRLESPLPVHRPSIFLYVVLENFVSNTVGLDLVGKKVVDF